MRRITGLLLAVAAASLSLAGVSLASAEEPSATTTTSSTAAAEPLIVILDVSGSMSETAGSTVKLQAAKRSLEPVVRAFAGTGNVGIWTYPNAGDCGAGEYLVDVGDTSSVTEITREIDLTQAAGGTPTAAAIQAVADNLTSRKIVRANLLLVSDGESNCGGPPPCEVAAGLAATGFQITIQAVGFDISDAGREELECIAQATGGRYFDVGDGEELEEVITELGVPQVQLSVGANASPRAGESTTITATVTNPSALEAKDVRVNLTFKDAGSRTVFPAVIPPTIAIGNLPAGASAVRTWSVVAGAQGKVADAAFSVSAWSRGSSAAVVDRTFTTTVEPYTAKDLGEVFAGIASGDRSLVILGDSYSSGEGTGDYLPGTDDVSEACHRSSATYLVPLLDDADIDVDILACSGAVTGDFYRTDTNLLARRASSQLSQLSAVDRIPGAVVMTAGGNNIGFANIMVNCLGNPAGCTSNKAWVASRFVAIEAVGKPLAETYTSTWQVLNSAEAVAKRGGEFAPVVVLGYPQLMHESRFGPCGKLMSAAEVDLANQFLRALNFRVQRSVAQVRSEGYEVYFVPDTQGAMLPGHTVCEEESDRWINGLSLPPETYHPNTSGYESITNRIVEWSASTARSAPRADRQTNLLQPPPPIAAPVILGLEDLTLIDTRVDFDLGQGATTQQGASVTIHASGFMPGDSVIVQLHSAPMALETATADENGEVNVAVIVPTYAELGSHELVLSGLSSDGDYLEQTVPLSVVPPAPWWLIPLIALSLTLGMAALILFVIAGRRRSDPEEP